MTQSQKNGNAISALRPEIKSQVQLGRLVSKASGSHHNLAPYDDIWGQIQKSARLSFHLFKGGAGYLVLVLHLTPNSSYWGTLGRLPVINVRKPYKVPFELKYDGGRE